MEQQTQTQPQVRPKLRMPHPSVEAARRFREEWNAEHSQLATPDQQATTAADQPVPAPSSNSVDAPAPAQQPQEEVRFANPLDMQVPSSYFMHGDATRPDYRQMESERDALRKELEETRRSLAEMRANADRSRVDTDIDAYLDRTAKDLYTIDREDAKKLLTPLVHSFHDELTKVRAATDARVKELSDSMNKQSERERQRELENRLERTRQAVLRAHPDLAELQRTDAYKKAMLTPVGGNSSLLIGNVVATEFANGNVEYVVGVLDRIKRESQGAPTGSLDSIASVSGTVAATAPARQDVDNDIDLDQLEQMKVDVQTGKMSRRQFREAMQKHRGANAARK